MLSEMVSQELHLPNLAWPYFGLLDIKHSKGGSENIALLDVTSCSLAPPTLNDYSLTWLHITGRGIGNGLDCVCPLLPENNTLGFDSSTGKKQQAGCHYSMVTKVCFQSTMLSMLPCRLFLSATQ